MALSEDEQKLKESLERLEYAIKEFAQLEADLTGVGQILVTGSVVMFERVRFDEDGDNIYQVKYTFPQEISLSSAHGLTNLGAAAVNSDLEYDPDEED